jgi:hypothetical protein
MKRRQFVLAVALQFILLPLMVRAAQAESAIGSHGMAVFGGKAGLYASHLPMFHSPHDTQLVLRFHLADTVQDATLRKALDTKPTLWTLDPERFDLLRFKPGHANPIKQFRARFVEGHFERGGKERMAGQTVVVDEVLVFRRLSTALRSTSVGRYVLVGADTEWFAVKEIDRRPDFDHIVRLSGGAAPKANAFRVPVATLNQPETAALNAALVQQLGPGWRTEQTLYFETGDLQ